MVPCPAGPTTRKIARLQDCPGTLGGILRVVPCPAGPTTRKIARLQDCPGSPGAILRMVGPAGHGTTRKMPPRVPGQSCNLAGDGAAATIQNTAPNCSKSTLAHRNRVSNYPGHTSSWEKAGINPPPEPPITLTAARNIAPILLGQPCNLAILRALGTSGRRCARRTLYIHHA